MSRKPNARRRKPSVKEQRRVSAEMFREWISQAMHSPRISTTCVELGLQGAQLLSAFMGGEQLRVMVLGYVRDRYGMEAREYLAKWLEIRCALDNGMLTENGLFLRKGKCTVTVDTATGLVIQ